MILRRPRRRIPFGVLGPTGGPKTSHYREQNKSASYQSRFMFARHEGFAPLAPEREPSRSTLPGPGAQRLTAKRGLTFVLRS